MRGVLGRAGIIQSCSIKIAPWDRRDGHRLEAWPPVEWSTACISIYMQLLCLLPVSSLELWSLSNYSQSLGIVLAALQ